MAETNSPPLTRPRPGHSSSSPDSGNPPDAKRRKRNRERVRVTRACDRCKKRKIKCNGIQPCEFCARTSLSCTFEASYARGRVPAIPSAVAGDDESQGFSSRNIAGSPGALMGQAAITMMTPSDSSSTHHHVVQTPEIPPASLAAPAESNAMTSSRASPEPSQTDLQGHYIGPASGVSFLLRVQKRLHRAVSFSQTSSIFTFGDAPLPDFDPSFCMVLPKEEAQRLVDRYFDFAMPTYRFLHRPTIQKWLGEFYDTLGMMRDKDLAPAKIALLFMVFAQGRSYLPAEDPAGPSDISAQYFLVAEQQLAKEKGAIGLTSVQARLAQCYYLLAQSRINHCWSLFGTTTHLALAIGLNRKRRPDAAVDHIEAECRRRAFWCAYTLDNYLSIALGRPRTFHDDDIDQDMPSCVDDDQLMANHIGPPPRQGQSLMLAPIAHAKLSRIVSKILRDIYSIRPLSAHERSIFAEKYSKELRDWRVDLSKFLDADAFSTSLLIPIFLRQKNVLNLAYWHAVILAHRPFLLSNFAQQQQGRGKTRDADRAQTAESVRQCLVASMNIVDTVNEMTHQLQMFRAFWITAYFAFTAVVVLYVYTIQQRHSSPDTYQTYFSGAARCQAQISRIAQRDSLTHRYCLVLEELRLEALRQTRPVVPVAATAHPVVERHLDAEHHATDLAPSVVDAGHATSYIDLVDDHAIDLDGMSNSPIDDFASWGQFASLVSSGLGNLDALLDHESLGL